MKILFFTHYYEPEVGPATKRIAGLAKNLKAQGHQVSIVTGFPNYPSGIKSKEYSRKLFMKEQIDGIDIYRYYIYSSPNKTSFVRILNYLSLMLSSLFFIFNLKKYDHIVATSPPLFTSLSGFIVSRFKKSKFILDVRDVWPDIGIEMGELSKNSMLYRVMNRISNFLYKKSDLITVVTYGKKEKLSLKGISKEKIAVISNGFDKEVLNEKDNYQLIDRYNIKEKFTLVYAGIIGLAQGMEIIIEAAKHFNNNNNIQFLIVGDGYKRKELEEKAINLGLTNIYFVGMQPHSSVISILKNADASIVPLKSDKLQDSVPTKMLESLGIGCPVILCAGGEARRILEKSNGGIAVNSGDHIELVSIINQLYNKELSRTEMSESGREFVLQHFTRDEIANKLSDVLSKLG